MSLDLLLAGRDLVNISRHLLLVGQ